MTESLENNQGKLAMHDSQPIAHFADNNRLHNLLDHLRGIRPILPIRPIRLIVHSTIGGLS